MITCDHIYVDICTFFSQISDFSLKIFQKILWRVPPQNLQILANLSLCGPGGFPHKARQELNYHQNFTKISFRDFHSNRLKCFIFFSDFNYKFASFVRKTPRTTTCFRTEKSDILLRISVFEKGKR